MRRAWLCACLCLLLTSSALAQAATPAKPAAPVPSPETVVQSYADLMKKAQYAEMAALMHPEALEQFRSALLSLTEEGPSGRDPGGILELFKGVPSVEALKKLSPTEFLAAFFAGMSELNPGLKEMLASIQVKTLGSVKEDDIVHVVCKTSTSLSVSGVSVDEVNVTSTKQYQGQWKVLLASDIKNMVQAIRNTIAQGEATE